MRWDGMGMDLREMGWGRDGMGMGMEWGWDADGMGMGWRWGWDGDHMGWVGGGAKSLVVHPFPSPPKH